MASELFPTDVATLDVLRKRDALTVPEIAERLGVTATAIRQRLNRLMANGYVERELAREGRGRPSHRYRLTTQGRRKSGENFADLAIVLWQELRHIESPEIRQGLLRRISERLAENYAGELRGTTVEAKLESLAELFSERGIPFDVDSSNQLPVLQAHACPYPELAEQDRSVCAMERLMFSEVLGVDVRLSECRLDGESCCSFEFGDRDAKAS